MDDNARNLILAAINAPIDPNLPVPIEISEIANVETAKPGELVRKFDYSDEDAGTDVIAIYTDGKLTINKVDPVTPVILAFVGLQSQLEYVLIDEVLPAVDQDALGRRKAGISRAMDKQEVKRICDAILTLDGDSGRPECEVVQGTGDDVLKLITDMKLALEDYGTDYALLVGSAVSNAIDTYEIDNVNNYGYNIDIKGKLAGLGITVTKVVGKVNGIDILATNKLILVARNSKLAAGKPITFIRRQMTPEIAKLMNSESVDRAISVAQAPQIIIDSGTAAQLLGYGVFGYESIIEVITNYRAICWATLA